MYPQVRTNTSLVTVDHQAIAALCTPRGSGAIALIRISGVNALAVVDCLAKLSSGTNLSAALTHTIHHGKIVDNTGITIDEVLFLVMRAPKTFTGQDTVEITCHNNPFIIDKILELAIQNGARPARHGEFTKRAFLNGKIDLLQAESINDLIHAQTELALRQSLAQVQGSLSHFLQGIEAQLVALLGYVEASFEFLDEEQRDFDFDQAVKDRTNQLLVQIKDIKKHFAAQQHIRQGVRIALVGMVNAGKSTLFNALVGKDRAIVADQEGTTRDSIETSLYKEGNFWLIIDTAGLRQTDDVIEKEGIIRSLAEAAHADVILLVMDATRSLTGQQQAEYEQLAGTYRDKTIVVLNKIDQSTNQSPAASGFLSGLPLVRVSARDKTGVDQLEASIQLTIQNLFSQLNSPYLLNQRQFKLLTEIETSLENIANSYYEGVRYELVAYYLKDLLEKVSELTGKNISENVMDMVFGEFCIGK